MKILSKKNNIIHLEFPSFKEITMTMGRAEEFYESGFKHLRNKVFTLETFLDTFTNDNGDVSYFNSWSGFNIPSDKLNEFFMSFNDLTEREKKLQRVVVNAATSDRYYVIATKAGDTPTIAHELVHANFYLNDEYKKAATKLVKALDKDIYNAIADELLRMGYAKAVIVDEVNAYLSTSSKSYLKKRFKQEFDAKTLKPFQELAKTVLNK